MRPSPNAFLHRSVRTILAAGLLSVLSLLPKAALSEEAKGPRVVLVTYRADESLLPLLRAELSALGFEVSEVSAAEAEVVPHDLSDAARNLHAVAAFRLSVTKGTVEVWIADRVTGKVVLREIFTQGERVQKVTEREVVMQAVELLRASLMEMEAPHPSRGEVKEPAVLEKVTAVSSPEERYWFGLSAAFLYGPGGTSPGMGASAGLGARFGMVGLGVSGGSLFQPARLVRSEGTAELTTRWISGEVLLLWPGTRARLFPRLALGLGAVMTTLHGIAIAPYLGHDDLLVSPAASARIDLGYRLTAHLRLVVGVSGFLSFRSDSIVFDTHEVGTFGSSLFGGNLGIEAVMP